MKGTGRANRLANDPEWKHSPVDCEDGAEHTWQPVEFDAFPNGLQPELTDAKVYVVCMTCHTWSYILAEFAGFYVPSPDVERQESMEGAG